MNPSVVGLVIVALLIAVLAAWGTRRAWRLPNAAGRWVGAVVSGLVALITAVAAIVLLMGLYKLRNQDDHPIREVDVPTSAAALDRGEKLVVLCSGCHGPDHEVPPTGSKDNFLEDLGTLHAPNLTPGGVLEDRSPGRIARAIREGVGVDGRPLLIMPSPHFHYMSDDDVGAIIAYLQTLDADDHEVPKRVLGPMATFFIGAGMFPLAVQEPITKKVKAPDPDDVDELGEYTTKVMACAECHGADYHGITEGNGPQGPDITYYADTWSAKEWRDTIRTGVDPTGNELDPDEMPWKEYTQALSDDELDAIRRYVRTFADDGDDD